MKTKFVLLGSIAATLFASSPALMADSVKVLFAGNGHYYQSVISAPKLWNEAQSACQKLGAHLVTITSKAENDFLNSSSELNLALGYEWNWFGASQVSGKWIWVTGEPFSYNNFASGQSSLKFLIGMYNFRDGKGAWWSQDDYPRNYVCEWEPKTYTSVLGLPDLNSNSAPESAGLFIDTKTFTHTVAIKDTNTQETINTITFDTKNVIQPIDMAQVSDMDGNGAPEIAVMYWTKKSGAIGSMIGLMIKDASTGNASRSAPITILSNQYKAISLTSTADITGDGVNELEVLVMQYKNSAVTSQIIDPVAGTVVKTVNF